MARSTVRVLIPRYSTEAVKRVWLTFDDGPHPTHTKKVLDVLKDKGVKATFFLVGQNVSGGVALVKRAKDEGHCIANHSFSHPNLTTLTVAAVREQIQKTHDLIKDYLGTQKLFRPPYGASNATVDGVIADLGYRKILWSVDTLDWKAEYQPDRWVQHGIDQIRARDDSVVLNHDIHRTTADNLAVFIDRIRGLGAVTFETCATL